MNKLLIILLFLLINLLIFLPFGSSFGKMYKYKDRDGNWCLTNENSTIPNNATDVSEVKEPESNKTNLKEILDDKCLSRTKIEEARNATVSIRGLFVTGSGFFITDIGYILTNRHVAEGSAKLVENIENKLNKNEVITNQEKLIISKASEGNPYDLTCSLASDEEMPAYLVAVSYKHDLALLRVRGYKTPSLFPQWASETPIGTHLYAIGNPSLGGRELRGSVTSGVFSALRKLDGNFYVQTNAEINSGNSGGPLITKEGKVVGINTMKAVGVTIEGIGLAIPVEVAIDEFQNYLGKYLKKSSPSKK